MYSALDIAEYIVNRCALGEDPISNLQLQKILYYIQLNFLKRFNRCAFNDKIEAWRHGPVVKDVYKRYNIFGRHCIIPFVANDNSSKFKSQDKEFIDQVIDVCTRLEPWELVDRSHTKGGPWDQTFDGTFDKEIPVEVMREYVQK
nr:MAG TPA: hypothetical protein [Caudoviricetes sp.]